jgi:CRP/FNR family transcriptional regulator, anaerobic regulatory protein
MSTILTRSCGTDRRTAPDVCVRCGVRSSSVCDAIPDGDLNRLAAARAVMEIAAGTTFIEEGEPAVAFFNITRGTARLFKLLPDGRRQITGFAHVGHFLGLAVSDTFAFSAEAIGTVRLCRFSRPRLGALRDDFPAMEKRLLEVATNELVAAHEQMLLLGRKTARERVASFLVVAQSRQVTVGLSVPSRIAVPMTRSDIADYLGLTVETVSRTLTRFVAEGLIDIPSHAELVIRARDELENLANGLA